MSTKPVIEAIAFLHAQGSRAVWYADEGRHLWYAPVTNAGRQQGMILSGVIRDYWTAIDELLQGLRCNSCGDELDDHEQVGIPICVHCWMDGVIQRPLVIREFVMSREECERLVG